MTTLIKVDAGRVHEPVTEEGSFPVKLELCQLAGVGTDPRLGGVGPLRNVKVNDLSPLPPMRFFRDEVMKYAKIFIREYAKRGYEPNQPEGDMRLWGPYRPRDRELMRASDFAVRYYDDPLAHAIELGVADFILVMDFLAPRMNTFELDPESGRNAARAAVAMVAAREKPYMERAYV
jgi:hypothetical protein